MKAKLRRQRRQIRPALTHCDFKERSWRENSQTASSDTATFSNLGSDDEPPMKLSAARPAHVGKCYQDGPGL